MGEAHCTAQRLEQLKARNAMVTALQQQRLPALVEQAGAVGASVTADSTDPSLQEGLARVQPARREKEAPPRLRTEPPETDARSAGACTSTEALNTIPVSRCSPS